jgi:phage major head subunit gpT-like protein
MPTTSLGASSAIDLPLIVTTATAKYDTILQENVQGLHTAFTAQDTYGTEGWIPTMLGGMGPSQEWLTTRVLHESASYGVRFVGKVYANGQTVKKETLRVSPVKTAAKIAAQVAKNAQNESYKRVMAALIANIEGFDKDPLFGDHRYSSAVDATVFSNDMGGTGEKFYLVNADSMVEVTADGCNYALQVYAGDNTSIDFMEDSMAFGWRAVKIFGAGFWANSIRSGAALTSENLRACLAKGATFRNDTGERLGQKYTHLLVGQGNASAAEKLIKAALVNGGDTNIDYGRLQLLVLDELTA